MRDNKMNVPCCLACLLLVLVMITTHMTSGLYARYITRASSEDEARVAKFDVDVIGSVKDLNIVTKIDDSTGEYQIDITNNSEVVVRYEMGLVIDGELDWITGVFDSSEGNLNFGETKTILLTFKIDEKKLTDGVTGNKVNETVNFKVIVDIVQVD